MAAGAVTCTMGRGVHERRGPLDHKQLAKVYSSNAAVVVDLIPGFEHIIWHMSVDGR